MMTGRKQLTDEQAERKARLIMLAVGIVAFSLGVLIKIIAKDNAVELPSALIVIMEFIAWPFWIGGFFLVLLGLGMKTGDEK